MVTCEKLSRRPQAAPSLIGMTLEAFDKLFAEFAAAHAQRLAVRPDGLIEAVSERVPGGQTHDLTLLRQTDLISQLDEGEAAILDKGYDGLQEEYPDKRLPFKARRHHPLTEEQKAYNRLLARFSIVVEHTLACLNRFQVLRQVYRHRRSEHSRVGRIGASLVDRRIATRPLKVYADAGA